MFQRKLQYFIKWEGYRVEHNSWESAGDVHAPDLVAQFHFQNPGAPQRIRALAFGSIPFQPTPTDTCTLGQCFSKGGVIVRGTSFSSLYDPKPPLETPTPISTHPLYVPPHLRSPNPYLRQNPTQKPPQRIHMWPNAWARDPTRHNAWQRSPMRPNKIQKHPKWSTWPVASVKRILHSWMDKSSIPPAISQWCHWPMVHANDDIINLLDSRWHHRPIVQDTCPLFPEVTPSNLFILLFNSLLIRLYFCYVHINTAH